MRTLSRWSFAKQVCQFCSKSPFLFIYKGAIVGEYFADLLIEDVVLVELKATSEMVSAHEAQLLNYLKATNIEVGLILNFGEKPDHRESSSRTTENRS